MTNKVAFKDTGVTSTPWQKTIKKEEIIAHPANSYWLKRAIEELDQRDPIDALRDLRTLQIYLEQKLMTIQKTV